MDELKPMKTEGMSSNVAALFGSLFLSLLYFLVYMLVNKYGGSGTDFLILMGLFWLSVIALRMK